MINTNVSFRIGTGEIDDLCYLQDKNSNHSLNRYDAIRLLSVLSKQCQYLKLSTSLDTNTRDYNNERPSYRSSMQENKRPPPTKVFKLVNLFTLQQMIVIIETCLKILRD